MSARLRRHDPDEEPGPDSDADNRIELRVDAEEHGQRLDRFLAQRLQWRSRSSVERLIKDGKVELDQRSPRPSRKVQSGELILVQLPKARREVELDAREGDDEIEVIHEDRWLLAVNKPAGIPVHPGGRLLHRTVITELTRRYRKKEPELTPKLCHRLDLETSGVLLLGKDDQVVTEIGRQLRERTAHKEYRAIVHGEISDDEFEVDAPVGPSLSSEIELRRQVRPDGEEARTSFQVERRFRSFTLLRIQLHTGRRHQIRVHLHHLGYPIVGDKLYGLDERFFLAYHQDRLDAEMLEELILPRQALHACRLRLTHPARNEELDLHAPLPPELADFLESLEPIPEGGRKGR